MNISIIAPTKLLYLEDTHQAEGIGTVLSVQEIDGRGISLVLDQTIFYPQGGGQPTDKGIIQTNDGGHFIVEDVRMMDGIVHHFGNFIQGTTGAGDRVQLKIDITRRILNARLHSSGHLIDAAIQTLNLPLIPSKGYHFSDGPYVEYEGEIEEAKREEFRVSIEAKVNELVKAALVTNVLTTTKAEMLKYCPSIPDYISNDKPVRVITIAPPHGCPCGGTHVKNSNEIGQITLTKIKTKKSQTRISYALDAV